jgi:hypothetical protein
MTTNLKGNVMQLIDKQDAADMMDIPVYWLDGMIEQGKLEVHKDANGFEFIDSEEIIVKRYASKELETSSPAHIRHLLTTFLGEARAREILHIAK